MVSERKRCMTTGCNPLLVGSAAGVAHHEETGHYVAPWPRSGGGRGTMPPVGTNETVKFERIVIDDRTYTVRRGRQTERVGKTLRDLEEDDHA